MAHRRSNQAVNNKSSRIQPTGPQIERLLKAMLSAYPWLDELRRMMRIRPDISLDAIVPLYGQNQTEIRFALIEHCAAKAEVCMR